MRRQAYWTVFSVLMLGCALLGPKPSGEISGNEYVDLERHFSFQVPSGWAPPSSRNPFRKPSYLVRVETVEGDAAAEVNRIALGNKSCIDAIRDWLQESSTSKFGSPEPFTIQTAVGELPSWRAELEATETGRRGRAVMFCEGGAGIVLVASANRESFSRHEKDLGSILESFAHRVGKDSVRVAPLPPAPPPISYFIHEVQWRGQTLGQIARWYTGKYENWKKLTEINDLTVADAPLKVGRQVKIPPELVVRQTPMPKPKATVKRAAEPPQGGAEQTTEEIGSTPPPAVAPEPVEPAPAEEPEPPPALPPVIGPR